MYDVSVVEDGVGGYDVVVGVDVIKLERCTKVRCLLGRYFSLRDAQDLFPNVLCKRGK